MKSLDGILPPAKTELEEHSRWMNRIQTQLRTLSYYHKKKIDVKDGDSEASCEHELYETQVEDEQYGLNRRYEPLFRPIKIYHCLDCGYEWSVEND